MCTAHTHAAGHHGGGLPKEEHRDVPPPKKKRYLKGYMAEYVEILDS